MDKKTAMEFKFQFKDFFRSIVLSFVCMIMSVVTMISSYSAYAQYRTSLTIGLLSCSSVLVFCGYRNFYRSAKRNRTYLEYLNSCKNDEDKFPWKKFESENIDNED